MPVTVSHDSGNWIIAGKRNKITINEKMAKLHERVAFLEMTKHEFLDPNYKQERTTFADGTTVTVDWDHNSFTIQPELKK